MKISVGIDGYNLALPAGTGIATYSRTLASAIRGIGWQTLGLFDIDVGNDPALAEIKFFERLEHPHRKQSLRTRMGAQFGVLPRVVEIPLGSVDQRPLLERLPQFDRILSAGGVFQSAFRYFQRTGQLASLAMCDPPAIMHWTCPLPLRIAGSRNVYTLHDLVPLKMPYMTLDNKRLVHAVTRACIEGADHLCAVSQATADEVVDLFPSASGRITITYQTYDMVREDLPPERESRAIVARMGLEADGYFLFYGALEPKKNVARLIEAHAGMAGDTPLVIVTGHSWNSDVEQGLLDRMGGTQGRLIVLRFLPRGMLQALIRHARAVTFPSLHEGFGLPALEAMHLGVPTLTSSGGALAEVAGGGALMVDAYDVADIRAGLERIDGNPVWRRQLAEQGRIKAEEFSPARYRDVMQNLYHSVMMKAAS